MMDELESDKYFQRIQIGLPDGETTTPEGWVITMSGGKAIKYIEPLEDNPYTKLVYDTSQGTVLQFDSQSYCFGESEEGMDHAYACMRYIENHSGKLSISFEELKVLTYLK